MAKIDRSFLHIFRNFNKFLQAHGKYIKDVPKKRSNNGQ